MIINTMAILSNLVEEAETKETKIHIVSDDIERKCDLKRKLTHARKEREVTGEIEKSYRSYTTPDTR